MPLEKCARNSKRFKNIHKIYFIRLVNDLFFLKMDDITR